MLNTIKMSEDFDLNELWRYLDSGILPLLFVPKASNIELLFALVLRRAPLIYHSNNQLYIIGALTSLRDIGRVLHWKWWYTNTMPSRSRCYWEICTLWKMVHYPPRPRWLGYWCILKTSSFELLYQRRTGVAALKESCLYTLLTAHFPITYCNSRISDAWRTHPFKGTAHKSIC